MKRRTLMLSAAAAALARPAVANAASTLRFVPGAPLAVLDPVFSTANVTVNHGYAIFDTLYAVDSGFRPRPQMAAGHVVSDDGLTWTIRLREGLRFHDGEPVRSADCIASLRRWTRRDAFGQFLARAVAEWQAPDDATLRLRLHHRFPALPDVLAKPTGAAFIMPERLARTDIATQVSEMVGSGPFRFQRDEFIAGTRAVYRRFDGYVPRQEPSDWAAGGKVAGVERIEWTMIPDASTAAAALQAGDVDWWESVPPDLVSLLRTRRAIRMEVTDSTGFLPIIRFNTLHPPFDKPALRHALLRAVHQADYLALVSDPADPQSRRECHSFFPCGTAYGEASTPDPMARPADVAEARRLIAAAGYDGERIVIINPSDMPTIAPLGEMTHDLLRRLGMNSELVTTDWATVVQRRGNRGRPDQGGWTIFHTWNTGASMSNPIQNLALRGAGASGWFGWYGSDAMEAMAAEWLAAETETARLAIAARMQALGLAEAPSIPLGQFFLKTAYRREVTGIRPAPVPFPWGVRKG
jgi:peptide/nickel transport system substrate-binding protein